MSRIHIGYLNVGGLRPDIVALIPSLLSSPVAFALSPFDILFLAETWFTPHHMDATALPSFIGGSLIPPKVTGRDRLDGGILCFGSPIMKQTLVSSMRSIDRLDLHFPSFQISGVYAPPHLDDGAPFRDQVSPISANGCSIGDFNVRFSPQGTANPAQRGVMIGDILSSLGVRFLSPFNKPSSIDCAISPSSWSPTLTALPAPPNVRDHPLLSFVISPPPLPTPSPPSEVQAVRFHMAALDDPRTISRLCDAFEAGAPFLCNLLDALHSDPPQSPAARVETIGNLDQLLRGLVEDAASAYLGIYSPASHRSPGPQRLRQFDPSDLASPLREWKRFCRSSRPAPLESSSPHLPAWEDTIQYFTDSFSQPAPNLLPPPVEMEGDHTIANWFTAASVHSFLSSYSKAKSCGIDGMHAKILWRLCARPPNQEVLTPDMGLPIYDFRQVLAALFRLCALWGCTPPSWNLAITHLLPKPNKPRTAAGSRPISLTSMLRRAFEKILLRGITTNAWLQEACTTFSRTQGGFRSGFSARAHLALASDMYHIDAKNWVFLDISAAYDRVPLGPLFQTLSSRLENVPVEGPGRAILSLVHSLFVNCGCVIAVNGSLTHRIPKARGLFQGSVLAPWLFNVFIDPLATLLDNVFAGPSLPRSLLFADDIALCPSSALQGQEMVDICNAWLSGFAMSLSPLKCASSFPTPIYIGDTIIPDIHPDTGYTYLGVPFVPGQGFLFSRAVDAGVHAAELSLSALVKAGSRWSARTRVSLYRAFIRSRWEYALPLLTASLPLPTDLQSVANRFQAVENAALNWCAAPVPAGRQRTNRFLFGIPPPHLRVQHLLLCWTFEGNNLANSHPIRRIPPWSGAIFHNGPRPPIWSNHGVDPRIKAFFRSCPDPLFPQVFRAAARDFTELAAKNSLLSSHSNLLRCILPLPRLSPSPRDRKPGVFRLDFSVTTRTPLLSRLALAWRNGVFGHFRKCPVCHLHFSPHHIESCNLLPDFNPSALLAWAHTRHFPPDGTALPERYSIIDELLNRREGALALLALQTLSLRLLPR